MYKPNRAMVLVLPLFATLMFGCSVAPTFSKPSVSISSPPNGAQVPMGQEVLIRAVANDTASIARVELWVDGNLNAVIQPTSRQAPYSAVLRWTPTSPGAHTLVVKAVNTSSVTSDPATIAITVTGSSTPTSIATATAPLTLSPLIVTATGTSAVPPALLTPTQAGTPSAGPFTGAWQGPDPLDGSTITLSLVQTGNTLSGTFSDTFSGNIPPPGFHGNGSGTVLSASTSQMTFNLTRWDGVALQIGFRVTLSNQNNTLTLSDCGSGCPIVLQRH